MILCLIAVSTTTRLSKSASIVVDQVVLTIICIALHKLDVRDMGLYGVGFCKVW